MTAILRGLLVALVLIGPAPAAAPRPAQAPIHSASTPFRQVTISETSTVLATPDVRLVRAAIRTDR